MTAAGAARLGRRDALEKFAKRRQDEHQAKSHAVGLAMLPAAAAASGGLGELSGLGQRALDPEAIHAEQSRVRDLIREGGGEVKLSPHRSDVEERLMSDLIKRRGAEVGAHPDLEYLQHAEPAYAPGLKAVAGPAREMTEAQLMHELDHAVTDVRNPRHYERTIPLALAGSKFTGGPSLLYSLGAANPSYVPAIAHLAMSAPTLADEALASGRAMRNLTRMYGAGAGLRRGLPLLPAFGTYAVNAAPPLAVTRARHAWQDE